jgi:hypothetical protein
MPLKKQVDFSETDGDNFATPEPGIYLVEIDDVEEKKSQAGNDMLQWRLKVDDPGGAYHNASILTNTVLVENSMWVLRNMLEATGFEFPDDPGEMTLDFEEFVGEKLKVEVSNEERDGETYANVESFYHKDAGANSSVDDPNEVPEADEAEDSPSPF